MPPARTATPTFLRAEPDAVVGQFGRGLSAVLRQSGGSVTLRLNPESLGQVKISLSLEESRVWARFEAASPETRQLLTQHADSLRHALEGRGLSVEHIAIVHEGENTPASGSRAPDPGATNDGPPSFAHHDRSPGREHSGQHPEQSAAGAPWRDEHTPAAEPHDDFLDPSIATSYAGLEAGGMRLRLDAIA